MAKSKIRKQDNLIVLIICIIVICSSLYFIGLNIFHSLSLKQEVNLSIASTSTYESFINNYKNLKVNVLKIGESEFIGDMNKDYFNDLKNNLEEVSTAFGRLQIQPYINKNTLNLEELYDIEVSSISILKNKALNETIELLSKTEDEELITIRGKMIINKDAYMVDLDTILENSEYQEFSLLGFNNERMADSIEPDYNRTMNNMNLAIMNYVSLSDLLVEQVRGEE